MFITGVDQNHEDLVIWWYENVRRHNPNAKIGIWDFGMSKQMREAIKGLDAWVSTPIYHPSNIGWFNKTKAVINTPSNSVAWLDVDCEVLANIEEVFDLVPPGMIGLTRDWVRANWWATGVIVVNDRPELLEHWNNMLLKTAIRGDQEMLYELVGNKPHEQIQELPQDYQWLRISLNKGKDSPTKKVIHWTGPKGKKFIREHLSKGRMWKGQVV
tara:strand:+ start:7291 stop:7932 length:642 start_codon:yes stop_codon:yes gene_type:complete